MDQIGRCGLQTSKINNKSLMANCAESEGEDENIDLQDSEGMNADQREMFRNISRSKSADSFIGKLLPRLNEVPDRDRSLVWDPLHHSLTHNIILSHPQPEQSPTPPSSGTLHVFKKIKKEKVRNKSDYDKNICGYITKKVIREFLGRNYEQEVQELGRKHGCSISECRSYYLRKVELVTGPSHLPDLLSSLPGETASLASCKRAFRQFYRWFLKERYLRYLLLEGKMTDKLAYIGYKNNHLFKFLDSPDHPHSQQGHQHQQEDRQLEQDLRELQTHMRTRSRSGLKFQGAELD